MSDQIEVLWNMLPHPSPEHVVRVAYRKDGKMVGDYARNLGELRRFANICRDRRVNAYMAPNPTCHTVGTRHSSTDVTHWSYLLIDIDPLADATNPEPMPVLREALLLMGEWLGKNLGGERVAIIDSGRGAQAWVRLADMPLGEGLLEWKHASRAMGYWLKKLADRIGTMNECRVDTSTSDLPRLMRLPGTLNVKTGREARIVQPGTGPVEGLGSMMVTGTPKEVFVEPEVTVVPGRTWQSAFSDLTRTAQQYLLNGQEEPGRHKACFHTAKKLAEVGCSPAEVHKALVRANSLAGEDQELSPSDLKHCLDTAFKK